MAEFIQKCQFCSSELKLESSWQGMDVKCPVCGKNFTVTSKDESIPPSAEGNSESNISEEKIFKGRKKEYFFGRLYITMARIVAVIILAITVTAVVFRFQKPFTIKGSKMHELKEDSNPKIISAQNKFHENYIRFAQLLLTASKSGTEFKFPADINRIDALFNNELVAEADMMQSIKTLELYQNKIENVSSHMAGTFKKHTDKIERLLSGGNAIVFNISPRAKKKNSTGALNLSIGQDVDFYKKDPEKVLTQLFIYLEELNQIRMKNSKLSYDNEISKIKKEVDFIDKKLNNKRKKISLEGQKNDYKTNEPHTQVVGREQYALEKELLHIISDYIDILSQSENWKISEDAAELKLMLLKHLQKVRKINREFEENLKIALISAGLILLSGIFTAFLIVVFADYLSAHFDSAVSLKSLDRKIKSFLLLPLACLFLLTGCGVSESPEKILTDSVESLRKSAMMAIFTNHIYANKESAVYGIPGKKLILIAGGQKTTSIIDCGDLKIASIAPCFNIAVLSCTSSATVGNFRKNRTGKYSHEAVLSLAVSYEICNTDNNITPDGTPGVAFHFLIPDNLSGKYYHGWAQNKFNKLPSPMPDHAVAINSVEKLEKKTSSELQIFKVLFNSETHKWELENEIKTVVLNPIPSAVSYENVNLYGTDFKKLSVNISGRKELLFIHKNDYETVDNKINRGLVLHNGNWKKKTVVEQTAKLQRTIEWWNAKEKVSLNDLKRVLLTVKECPEAENYAAAVELAEKAMINIFIAREKDFSANTRKSLVFILNFINNEQCTSSLNRQKLAEYCLKKIDEIDNFLKTILTSIANAKNEIDYALRRRNYKYLKSVLNKHKWFYDLSKNKAVLDKLIEIYNKNPNTVAKLYKERGLCGEYDLLSPCSSCNERGLANCKICDNTGKCPTCNGYGYKTFTASRWNGHDFEKYERRTPCYPRCSHCRGQTSKCYTCTGLGICIDEKKLQKAIESEIISLKRELIAIENNYTHK